MRRRLAFSLLVLLLSGCGPRVSAPSLAPRAAERNAVELPDPVREPKTPVDPAIGARLATLQAQAAAGDTAFAEARAPAERAIAAAQHARPGDEAWVVAQQALSSLDLARGPVRDAAAEIADLRQEPAAAGTGSRAAIDAAAARVEALEAAEVQAVTALQVWLR